MRFVVAVLASIALLSTLSSATIFSFEKFLVPKPNESGYFQYIQPMFASTDTEKSYIRFDCIAL
jgi:hypothetical protein